MISPRRQENTGIACQAHLARQAKGEHQQHEQSQPQQRVDHLGGYLQRFKNKGSQRTSIWGEEARFSHHLASTRIEFETTSLARGRTYIVVWGPRGADHWRRYADKLVKDGDQWLFVRRRVSVDGRASHSVTQENKA